jgi:CubicO group peptidase (beta-lactamase class C family)
MNDIKTSSGVLPLFLGLCLASLALIPGGVAGGQTRTSGAGATSGPRAASCPQGKTLRSGICVDIHAGMAAHIVAIARAAMKQHDLHAVILGMWIDKKEVVKAALGQSMTGVPATTHMHFRIGSIAIAYLTTLLLQLVDQKRVSLDDKLSKWLPSLPHADSITLGMLAESRSGYPDYEKSPALAIMAYLPSKKIAIAITSTLGEKSSPSTNYSTLLLQAIGKYLAPSQPLTT